MSFDFSKTTDGAWSQKISLQQVDNGPWASDSVHFKPGLGKTQPNGPTHFDRTVRGDVNAIQNWTWFPSPRTASAHVLLQRPRPRYHPHKLDN
jgi:hypothetical protein